MLYGLFGMIFGMIQQTKTQGRALDLLKTYAEQGKDPPPELLKALSGSTFSVDTKTIQHANSATSAWWTFIVFAALAAGFTVGTQMFSGEGRFAFLVVAVVMGVLAAGSLVMAIAALRKPRP